MSLTSPSSLFTIFAERLAMRRRSVLFLWRTIADMAMHDDQGWPGGLFIETLECELKGFRVIRIAHTKDIPAVGQESRAHVLAEGKPRRTFDGNRVAVVDPAEI